MNFFEQLQEGGLPALDYRGVRRARGLRAAIFRNYIKLFNNRLASFKALATVNDLPVYDLTQAPLFSEANQRVLQAGVDFHLRNRPARPISAVIAVTHACDCACRHCSARDYMGGGRRPLSYEELTDLFDQCLEMGVASIVLTGGEPTLHPRLVDLVAHVPKELASVAMFTNGARLDRGLAAELRSAGLNAALVSIDAADSETHDRLRAKDGSHARAITAVEALQAADTLVGISSYMTHRGLADGRFDAMLDLTRSLAAQQLFLFDAVPVGALRERDHTWLTVEDRDQLRRRTMAVNATHGGPGVMGQSWINSPDGFGCFAGFYQCYVTASGDVTPCDFTPISFGNVREERFDRIWERLRASNEWGVRAHHCRMQDLCFRSNSVDLIPEGEPLPVTYDRLEALRAQAARAGDRPSAEAPPCVSPA